MRHFSTTLVLFLFLALISSAEAQQTSTDSDTGNAALQALGAKAKTHPSTAQTADQSGEQSGVAEVARRLRGQDMDKVRVSPEEAERILKRVQPVLRFASEDSGLPIHSVVKPRMISRDDLRGLMQERKLDDDDARHLQETELTLKKFGYVPRSFSTRTFVEGMYAEMVAGFYDPKTKGITLLNWIAPEEQESVLAHELTHALQDQNYNLLSWEHNAVSHNHASGQFQVSEAEALQESDARRAAVEGQAMIVLIDYQWAQHGIEARLEYVPGASNALSQYLSMVPVPDSPVIHASPVVLREEMEFPYREGLVFELELLGKGGKALAFNHIFARPPANTHEILHPDAYLQKEKVQAPQIPSLNSVLADKYDVLDAGGLGELDIRSLIKQFENSRLAENLSRGWRGSSFLVVKRKQVAIENATTADVALIYISSWASSSVAQRFARFYADALPKRYSEVAPASVNCQGSGCPLEAFQFNTEEGFVSIERRPNNMVLVTESLDPSVAYNVNAAILTANSNTHQAASSAPELSSRYFSLPIFTDLRALWEQKMMLEMLKALSQSGHQPEPN